MKTERSPKSISMKWVVMLAVADVLAVLVFLAPEVMNGATLTQVGIGRILTTMVMPVLILIIVNVLPPDVKAMLVFWKPRGVLPGCEAFTKHGPSDYRIDMAALKKNVGALPDAPSEQNAKWYKLYKLVQNDPAVAEAQKDFLMYRDMATLSVPLILIVPLSLSFAGVAATGLWLALGFFTVQYLLTALSARWSGIRFVRNVLAVHATRRVTTSSASPTKQSSIQSER
ncbi:hypothetical protein GOB91_29950 [Sinorhizobium meliloti]|uniref:hypothetical protein n=1 Tax=Rhizobium meliloti TaxID=382 RepID=UPI000FDB959D|nr:hypothetical protein [Sinorhizobium meliloti]MDW9726467.1 hypothetical protein [Sinorhizobium meliloti]MDW9729691.1 hypothetical protein [Sinorhizobium meliloti]RVE82579.1 hypothetical protein CN238_27810 [Sinorhizobium meliloti]RVH23641.1 hypothetical protein CN214_27405 [Sinorhizobium meliloti]